MKKIRRLVVATHPQDDYVLTKDSFFDVFKRSLQKMGMTLTVNSSKKGGVPTTTATFSKRIDYMDGLKEAIEINRMFKHLTVTDRTLKPYPKFVYWLPIPSNRYEWIVTMELKDGKLSVKFVAQLKSFKVGKA